MCRSARCANLITPAEDGLWNVLVIVLSVIVSCYLLHVMASIYILQGSSQTLSRLKANSPGIVSACFEQEDEEATEYCGGGNGRAGPWREQCFQPYTTPFDYLCPYDQYNYSHGRYIEQRHSTSGCEDSDGYVRYIISLPRLFDKAAQLRVSSSSCLREDGQKTHSQP